MKNYSKKAEAKMITNHYKWLDKNLEQFLKNLNIQNPDFYLGMISAHGDKCYSYRDFWEKHGIKFHHGVAIYLISYISPYSKTVRETKDGWVDPKLWVVDMYDKWSKLLPE